LPQGNRYRASSHRRLNGRAAAKQWRAQGNRARTIVVIFVSGLSVVFGFGALSFACRGRGRCVTAARRRFRFAGCSRFTRRGLPAMRSFGGFAGRLGLVVHRDR
jgi:hypothetical protein